MKVNLLLVVLLGLLALSYGFKLERNTRGRGKGGNRGGNGRPDDKDDDIDDDNDDDFQDEIEGDDLPRLIVGVLARRIKMQLDNCDLSGFDGVTSFKDIVGGLGELLVKDCGGDRPTRPPPPTGIPTGPSNPPPTDAPTAGPSPAVTDSVPARELEDKVVQDLMDFLEEKRHS